MKVFLKSIFIIILIGAGALLIARWQGYQILSVQTDSMAPRLQPGDAVVVHTAYKDLAEGDIVSYPSPKNKRVIVTHRVLAVDSAKGVVTTQGDNETVPDQPIRIWDLTGTVIYGFPKLGTIVNVLKNPIALILIIYLPALAIIVDEAKRLKHYFAFKTTPVHYELNR